MTQRRDWTRAEIAGLFNLSFDDLIFQAQATHRAHHATGEVEGSALKVR
jgi:biotin synthase